MPGSFPPQLVHYPGSPVAANAGWHGQSCLAAWWCPPIWAKGNRLAQPVSDRRGDVWI